MTSMRYCILTVAFVGVIGACTKKKSEGQLAHYAAEPAAVAPKFLWRKSSDTEYYTRVKGLPANKFLEDTHPFAVRLNFWIGLIDQVVRTRNSALLEGVPVPRAKVQISKEANASAASVNVCIPVKVIVEGGGSGEVSQVYADRSGFFNSNSAECIDAEDLSPETTAREFADWYNQNHSDCQIKVAGDTVTVPVKCTNGEFAAKGKSQKIALLTAVNAITVHSKLLDVFPQEEEFVSVIAHELAHYYRAHGQSSVEKYGYFYRQIESYNIPLKPAREPKLESLGNKIAALADFPLAFPIEGLRFRPEILPALRGKFLNNIDKICTPATLCNAPCGEFRTFMKTPETVKGIGGFPVSQLTPTGLELLKKYDRLLGACADTVSYTALEVDNILLNSMPPKYLSSLGRFTTKATTLTEDLIMVSQRITALDQEFTAVIEQANREKLGYYTTEQEADELAVDWLASMGLDPMFAVRQMMTLAEFADSQRPTTRDEKPFAECKDEFKRDWKKSDGTASWIPVGRWSDKHHSLCYRAWNMQREIKGHKFDLFRPRTAIENRPGGAWSDLIRSIPVADSN